jgi:hypothetical protein
MTNGIVGIVTNGVVIPNAPLPEGASVEIYLSSPVPLEVVQELKAWQQGSAEALALVERLAEEEQADETR